MYTEREMTLDALEIMKTGTVGLTQAATETSNPSLRQTLLHMRNQCEQSQQRIGQFATNKNYYMPAPPAPNQDVSTITQFLQQNVDNSNYI
jgi:spore coat protein CotF